MSKFNPANANTSDLLICILNPDAMTSVLDVDPAENISEADFAAKSEDLLMRIIGEINRRIPIPENTEDE